MGLARASCYTKEHIRNLLHAWRKALTAKRIQALCFAAPLAWQSQGGRSSRRFSERQNTCPIDGLSSY